MTKKDDKGLLNEVLPDPTAAARDLARGTPRERTRKHLGRLLAAAGLALPFAAARADNSLPPTQTGDKGKPTDGNKGKPPQPSPPPEPPGYGVVNPMPPPFIERNDKPGFLTLRTTPPLPITLDGVATGLKTPQQRMKLSPGPHTLTFTDSNGVAHNFSVVIRSGRVQSQSYDVRPPPQPK